MKILNKEECILRIRDYWPVFTIGVLGILGAIALNIHLVVTDQYFHWTSTVLSLIPGIVFLLVGSFAKKLPQNKWVQGIKGTFSAGCLIPVLLITYSILIYASWMTPENTYFYKAVIRQFDGGAQQFVTHFPKDIPGSAEDQRFFFFLNPGFGQGGSSLQLEYKANPEEIQQLEDLYRSQALCTFRSDEMDLHNMCGISHVFAYRFSEDSILLPNTFEIFLLDAVPQGSEDFLWNHGITSGFAIDKTNMIVFHWADFW